jgi:DNA adenine methylase
MIKSPLRYPGGKSRAINHILPLIPMSEPTILSSFLGGGSIELTLAERGQRVIAFDNFYPLVAFWQELLENSEKLSETVNSFYPLNKEQFYQLQKNLPNLTDKHRVAAVFFVLNRSSFSGSTLSGGMSPNHPRFTNSCIEKLKMFKVKNLTVEQGSFVNSINEYKDTFAYLDPPYLIKSNLYGNKGDMHKGFDHSLLMEILSQRQKWVLSYNDCDVIRQMYSKYRMLTPDWKYGMSSNKTSKEVIILSDDIIA